LNRKTTTITFLLFTAPIVLADTVRLKTGDTLDGVIIQEDAEQIVLAFHYGSWTVARSDIESIAKKSKADRPTGPPTGIPSRIPNWYDVLNRLAGQSWASKLQQIPATVIDKGVLRHVPYLSYRCGKNRSYELNIYGDPDDPACVEIGVYGDFLHNDSAKKKCVKFIAKLMSDTDAELVDTANLDKDLIERNGLTVETTPETAEDAYGGWWISVYDEGALGKARATEKELSEITVAKSPCANARHPKSLWYNML